MRAIALLMFVMATLPMAFVRPFIGLLLWVWFSYMNPHRLAFGFATSLQWVLLTASVTIIATLMRPEQCRRIPMKPVIVLMTMFLAWTGITTLAALEQERAITEWIKLFKILLMAYFTLVLVTDKRLLHWLLWTIVLSFGFYGFKGGLFTVLTGGSNHVLGPPDSFFRDNNMFALVMCMTIPLMRYLQLHEPRRLVRNGLWVLMALTALSVVGTYSRGGLLALGATCFVLVLKSRRRGMLVLIVPALALIMGAFMPAQYLSRISTINDYEQEGSAVSRIESWRFATNYALAHPITGGGFRVYTNDASWLEYGPPGAKPRAIHSIWFQVLGEQGFIGLGLFLGMLAAGWLSLTRVRKAARAGPGMEWFGDLASMIQVSFVAFMAAGTLLPMPYFDLFYQLLAVTALLQVFVGEALKHQAESTTAQGSQAVPETGPQGGRRQRGRPRIVVAEPSSRTRLRQMPPW